MKASSSGATSNDEYSRYLLDRIKQLEEMNTRLKERLESSEREGRYYEDIRTRYESEIRKLRSELEKLRAPPLIIGTVVEIVDEGKKDGDRGDTAQPRKHTEDHPDHHARKQRREPYGVEKGVERDERVVDHGSSLADWAAVARGPNCRARALDLIRSSRRIFR